MSASNNKNKAPQPMDNWLRRFGSEILDGVRKHVVKLVVAAIFASAFFLGMPLWNWIKVQWFEKDNITSQRALALARQTVGSTVQFAVPFKNGADPNQYIAVWATYDPTQPDPCILFDGDDDFEVVEGDCPNGTGKASATLLVGNGDTFQKIATNTYSFNVANPKPIVNDEYTAAYFQKNFGVTDWNGDGVKEILSIAASASPAITNREYQIGLFDTGSMSATYLLISSNRANSTQELIPSNAEKSLRAWLLARFTEYNKAYLAETCTRTLYGNLNCIMYQEDEEENPSQEHSEISELTSLLQNEWLQQNGSTFVTGKIQLSYHPGRVRHVVENGYCEIDDGDYSFVNAFKGPLMVVNNDRNQSAALYMPDGRHHREIPNVIVGEKFLWLSIRQGNKLIAVNKSNFEVVPVEVKEWEDGFPTEDDSVAKEKMVNFLMLSDGHLKYNDTTLSLAIDGNLVHDGEEFNGAKQCLETE